MDLSTRIAEERIQEAIKNGEFNKLKNKGKLLELDDLSAVPPELRMSYKILKNAGAIPEEVQLKKEMLTLEDLIRCCVDDSEKAKLKQKLNEKQIKFNLLMEKRQFKKSGAFRQYRNKIHNKLF